MFRNWINIIHIKCTFCVIKEHFTHCRYNSVTPCKSFWYNMHVSLLTTQISYTDTRGYIPDFNLKSKNYFACYLRKSTPILHFNIHIKQWINLKTKQLNTIFSNVKNKNGSISHLNNHHTFKSQKWFWPLLKSQK